jgi:hypothetical protein
MKVKITVIADIDGKVNSDMNADIQDKVSGLSFINDVTDVNIRPVIAKNRGGK